MKRRKTQSKEAVLEVLTQAGKAMSQNAIEEKVSIAMDRATIYRVLNRFCDDGVIHKIVAEDGKQYFAVCIKCDKDNIIENHFHFRCTRCDTIECLPIPVHFSLPGGYEVDSVHCILTGVCSACSVQS